MKKEFRNLKQEYLRFQKKNYEKKQKKRELSERLNPYKDRQRDNLSYNAYGAIIKINLDNTHPLAFGYNKDYFSLL